MATLLEHPQVKPLLANEHFSVEGALIDAWVSHKNFRPKDGSADGANFHDQAHKNDTHASTTDPDSRLDRAFQVHAKARSAMRDAAS